MCVYIYLRVEKDLKRYAPAFNMDKSNGDTNDFSFVYCVLLYHKHKSLQNMKSINYLISVNF